MESGNTGGEAFKASPLETHLLAENSRGYRFSAAVALLLAFVMPFVVFLRSGEYTFPSGEKISAFLPLIDEYVIDARSIVFEIASALLLVLFAIDRLSGTRRRLRFPLPFFLFFSLVIVLALSPWGVAFQMPAEALEGKAFTDVPLNLGASFVVIRSWAFSLVLLFVLVQLFNDPAFVRKFALVVGASIALSIGIAMFEQSLFEKAVPDAQQRATERTQMFVDSPEYTKVYSESAWSELQVVLPPSKAAAFFGQPNLASSYFAFGLGFIGLLAFLGFRAKSKLRFLSLPVGLAIALGTVYYILTISKTRASLVAILGALVFVGVMLSMRTFFERVGDRKPSMPYKTMTLGLACVFVSSYLVYQAMKNFSGGADSAWLALISNALVVIAFFTALGYIGAALRLIASMLRANNDPAKLEKTILTIKASAIVLAIAVILLGSGLVILDAKKIGNPAEGGASEVDFTKSTIASTFESIVQRGGDKGRIKRFRETLHAMGIDTGKDRALWPVNTEFAFFGWGAGAWRLIYPQFVSTDWEEGVPRNFEMLHQPRWVHNDHLEFFVETGVIGIALYGLFWIVLFCVAARYATSPDGFVFVSAICAGAGLMIVFTSACFDFPRALPASRLLFIALVALVCNLKLWSRGEIRVSREVPAEERKIKRLAFLGCGLILLAGALLRNFEQLSGEMHLLAARELAMKGENLEALREAEAACRELSYSERPLNFAAEIALRLGALDRAKQLGELSIQKNRTNLRGYQILANTELEYGYFGRARNWAERGLSVHAEDSWLLMTMGDIVLREAETKKRELSDVDYVTRLILAEGYYFKAVRNDPSVIVGQQFELSFTMLPVMSRLADVYDSLVSRFQGDRRMFYYQRAVEFYRICLDPVMFEIHRARLLLKMDLRHEAIAALEKLNSEQEKGLPMIGYLVLAEAYQLGGVQDKIKAREIFEQIMHFAAETPDADETYLRARTGFEKMDTLVRLHDIELQVAGGNYREALALLEGLEGHQRRTYFGSFLEGQCYKALGDTDKYIECFARALTAPENPRDETEAAHRLRIQNELADAYYRKASAESGYAKKREYYSMAFNYNPANVAWFVEAARMAVAQNDDGFALICFKGIQVQFAGQTMSDAQAEQIFSEYEMAFFRVKNDPTRLKDPVNPEREFDPAVANSLTQEYQRDLARAAIDLGTRFFAKAMPTLQRTDNGFAADDALFEKAKMYLVYPQEKLSHQEYLMYYYLCQVFLVLDRAADDPYSRATDSFLSALTFAENDTGLTRGTKETFDELKEKLHGRSD
ncbi:MAG: hypothetical protein NUW37_06225 [Planctomycetes bacterium]|nr:hypothetical protein [Planctomycetota bacterium]